MWKILQSLPRGIRTGLSNCARCNPCIEEDNDSLLVSHYYPHASTTISRSYSNSNNNGDQKKDQRFRINDDCWSNVWNHSLLEALGWSAALTAGIVASRPTLLSNSPDGRFDESRRTSLLLEYAVAMPIRSDDAGINRRCDNSEAVRTKVNRSDSGFSEARGPSEASPPPESAGTEASAYRLWETTSGQTDADSSDYSWDSSTASTHHLDDSESKRLLESLNVHTLNDVHTLRDVYKLPVTSSSRGQNDVIRRTKRPASSSAGDVDSKTDVAASSGSSEVRSRSVQSKPASFAEAVKEFDEICRHSYGYYCNDCAIRALKKNEGLKAVCHWLKASRVGYDKAQYNLGRCYEDGIGTYKDSEKAKYYYKLAAVQGHQAATKRLNRLLTTETSSRLFLKWTSADTAVKCNQQDSRVLG